MSRPILKGIVCDRARSQRDHQPRKWYLAHRKEPDGANHEYLKSQDPAEGRHKRGSGAVKVAIRAFPDSSDEQRYMLVGLSVIVCL